MANCWMIPASFVYSSAQIAATAASPSLSACSMTKSQKGAAYHITCRTETAPRQRGKSRRKTPHPAKSSPGYTTLARRLPWGACGAPQKGPKETRKPVPWGEMAKPLPRPTHQQATLSGRPLTMDGQLTKQGKQNSRPKKWCTAPKQ